MMAAGHLYHLEHQFFIRKVTSPLYHGWSSSRDTFRWEVRFRNKCLKSFNTEALAEAYLNWCFEMPDFHKYYGGVADAG